VPEHRAQVNQSSSSRVSFQELEAGRMFSPSRNSILLPRVWCRARWYRKTILFKPLRKTGQRSQIRPRRPWGCV